MQQHDIQLKLNDNNSGGFYIFDNGMQIAELEFKIEHNVLNAYHTGVNPKLQGQGIAGKLFDKMVEFAREKHYRVLPTCSYILAKFRRHPEQFCDIWERANDEPTGDACGVKPKK